MEKSGSRSLLLNFKRYLVGVKYAGSRYSGWQSNSDAKMPSIIYTIEKAIEKYVGEGNFLNVKGSSRTDAGVHAIRNTFQIDLCHSNRQNKNIILPYHETKKVKDAVNFYLTKNRESIYITDVNLVDGLFDVRSQATSRTYTYRIVYPDQANDSRNWLFQNQNNWILREPLNIDAMKEAAAYLLGEHDFTSFRGRRCQSKTPYREITQFDISEIVYNDKKSELNCDFLLEDGNLLFITITANSFLYKMVRNLVGLLVEVGHNKLKPIDALLILRNKSKTSYQYTPAPAHGLYLLDVHYDKHKRDEHTQPKD